MLAVLRREIKNYFTTPIGYVYLGMFLVLSGIFFFLTNIMGSTSSLSGMMSTMSFLFIFMAPILTMRLFSEERKNKSDQLLLTSPLSLWGIVCGKFFAAAFMFLLSLAATFVYVLIIIVLGKPVWGELLTNYLGFFLFGACFIAVDAFLSATTENQVVAAIAAFGVNIGIYLLESIIPVINIPLLPFLPTVLQWLSVYTRYSSYNSGILSLSANLYMLSFVFVFILLTVRTIDRRRWS